MAQAAWAKVDVLVLDDLGLQPVSPPRAADLLEVIEDRAGTRSTIETSQLPVAHWHEALGEPTVDENPGLTDRIQRNTQVGRGAEVLERLWPATFDRYVSRVFEDVAAQYVWRLSAARQLPLLTTVGQQWLDAGDIDVVGVDGEHLRVAGSAKWTQEHVKPGDLADLRRDVGRIARDSEPELLLFSRSGFDPSLDREHRVRLVTLDNLFRPELDFESRAAGTDAT